MTKTAAKIPDYPEGITRMDDYLGAIVQLRRNITQSDGKLLRRGTTYITTGHWRGRLTLSFRDKSLGGHSRVAARQVPRDCVEVIGLRLA